MRIRSTKPEFWRSERIGRLTWDARLVLKGLESYVDDNGVGRDDIALIVADVFPRDMLAKPRETVARVSEAISELQGHGFVHRYEADGTRYLYLSWWDSTQRIDKPGKGRFPRPDGTFDYKESEIRDSVASPRESVAPVTGEQGNRGTVSSASATAEREFAEWYASYPRKRAKGAALKAFKAARKKASLQELMDAVEAQREALTAKGQDFVPYPATWLNGERWADEPEDVAYVEKPSNYRNFDEEDDGRATA